MSVPANQDPVLEKTIQDPAEDEAHHAHAQPLDHETEVKHAWQHFNENWKFFACFFAVVLFTVAAWSINFGPTGNKIAVGVTAVMRCALIAYFMLTLFKTFSLVRNTFIFCAVFLTGMVFLSWWDSEIPGIGDPIKDRIHQEPTPSHVP
jgi:lipopolysaccharide export LptBFGC system permease protein LptF